MRDPNEGIHMSALVTRVRSVEYDFVNNAGRLHLPPGCRADGSGSIKLFHRIDKNVRTFAIFDGEQCVDVYKRDDAGKWDVYEPPLPFAECRRRYVEQHRAAG